MLRPIATGWLMWSYALTMGNLLTALVSVVWFNGHMFIRVEIWAFVDRDCVSVVWFGGHAATMMR